MAEGKYMYSLDAEGNTLPVVDPFAMRAGETGGVQMELLWTNASPNSAFAAQTVLLDWSPYRLLMITSKGTSVIVEPVVDMPFHLSVVNTWGTGTGFEFDSRRGAVVSNGLSFQEGRYSPPSLSMAANNSVLVPIKIYGIKGVA